MMFLMDVLHELGHVLVAKFYKMKIERFKIMIYGTSASIKDIDYQPIIRQILVFLGGPFMVFFIQSLLLIFKYTGLISYYYFNLYTSMNLSLCLFNLLPIYPLDGGRILDVCLKYVYPVKKAIKIRFFYNIISTSLLVVILFIKKQFIVLIMLALCLISEVINYYQSYNNYLKDRYTRNITFKDDIVIYPELYHFKNNIYFVGGKYINENQMITKILLKKE